MESQQSSLSAVEQKKSYVFPMTGWLIGFGIISLFVFSEKNPKPEWGEYWMVKPLLLTPIITALSAFIMGKLINRFNGSIWVKILAAIFFVFTLWIGIVLGLNGTLWD